MTPAQSAMYFRAWGRVSKLHGWRTSGGRIVGVQAASWGRPVTSELYAAVWELARVLADEAMSDVTPDHIRHAVTHLALGEHVSSREYTNKQFDRVLALLRLLTDPDDVKAMLDWQDRDGHRGRRVRQEYTLRHAQGAYVRSVSADKDGTRNWQALDDERLNQLHMTIKNRTCPSIP